ncbi:MAG: protein-disulfide reductase DsbD family protein [Gammaproteobacteria bacterium]
MKPLLALMWMLLALPVQADTVEARHVRVTLLSEQQSVAAGEPFWVQLAFKPQAGWHSYWKNPGDSGLAPRLEWQLPNGWQVDAPLYPTPEAIPYGSQMNYGYSRPSALLIRLLPPATLTDATVTLQLDARWLVCADACVPGEGQFQLSLPVAEQPQPDPDQQQAFASARARLPVALHTVGHYSVHPDYLLLQLPLEGLPGGPLQPFVAPGQLVDPSAEPVLGRNGAQLTIRWPRHTYFTEAPAQIDVVLRQAGKGWSIPATLQIP